MDHQTLVDALLSSADEPTIHAIREMQGVIERTERVMDIYHRAKRAYDKALDDMRGPVRIIVRSYCR